MLVYNGLPPYLPCVVFQKNQKWAELAENYGGKIYKIRDRDSIGRSRTRPFYPFFIFIFRFQFKKPQKPQKTRNPPCVWKTLIRTSQNLRKNTLVGRKSAPTGSRYLQNCNTTLQLPTFWPCLLCIVQYLPPFVTTNKLPYFTYSSYTPTYLHCVLLLLYMYTSIILFKTKSIPHPPTPLPSNTPCCLILFKFPRN